MKGNLYPLTIILLLVPFLYAQEVAEPRSYDQLIDAVITRPWPGVNYPPLPAVPKDLRQAIQAELRAPKVRRGYQMLDATRRNVEWFEGITVLEKEGAVWALVSCLSHPSDDVQIYSLRSLERLRSKKPIPFLLTYAEAMAVLEGGSENATVHGVIHATIAKTLSALTGIEVTIVGQDPEGLKKAIGTWRAWHKKNVQ